MIAKRRSTEGGVGRGGRRKRSTAWRLLGMVPRGWLVVVLAVSAASTALDAAAQDCCYCTHWQVDVWSFSAHDTCDFNGSECTCDLAEDEDECQATCLMNYNLGDLDCNGGSFEYAGRRTYTTCTHLTDINASCNGTRTSGIPAGSCLEGDPECRCAADPCDDVVCTGGRICENQDGLAACVCRDGEHRHQGAPACHGTTDTGTGHACPDNQHKHTHSVSGCGPDHTCPPGQEIYDHDKCDPWPGNGCPGTKVDRDPRPGTVVCSSSCRPNASVVQSTGVCACDDGYEVDSIGRCVAIVVDIHPNNGCDIAGRVNRNGNCDYTGCGNNADTDGNGYCVCAADYRYPNTTTLHCSQCADGSVPDGRACRMCEDGESSPGVCRDCGTHAGWNGSACVCDTCFEDTDTGDGLACAEKTCGVNEECRGGNGQCSCIASHHAHDALACHAFGEHGCPDDQHDDTHPGTCHGTHICTAPLVLEGHDSCVCPVGQHDDTHPGTCHGTHICTAPLVLEGHDSCGCPAGQHDETHPGTCHGTHICTAPLVLEGHDSCVCPAGQHDETHPGTCHGTHICTAPLVLEGHDSCVCPAGQHDETHPGTCHGTHICTAPLVLEGHDSCVCPAGQHDDTHRGTCHGTHICTAPLVLEGHDSCVCPAGQHDETHRGTCHGTHICTAPLVLEGHDSCVCPAGQHDDTHRGTCHGTHICTAPLVLEGHDSCVCPAGQHDETHRGTCHGTHICTAPLVLEGHDSCVCPAGQHDDTHRGTCHGTHICTAPLVLEGHDSCVCPAGQHDETHRGTCHGTHICTAPLVLEGHDSCVCPAGQHDDTHRGTCHDDHGCTEEGHHAHDSLACHDDGTEHACPDGEHKHEHNLSACGADHICTAPLVLEGHDSCVCPAGQHDDTHPGTCHDDHECTEEGHHAHDSLACHDDGTEHACPDGEHKHEHNPSACVADHPCPENAEVADHRDHDPTTATCECEEDHSDDPDVDGLQCVEDVVDTASCGADQAGTPPDCTECGRHRVPNAAGTVCEACPGGQAEGFPGLCMPVGNCTRLGSYWPGAESGCVGAGLVGANAQCSSTCRANSADNGWGVCVCDPGYVYTVPTGALSGPTNCVRRTDELCGAASDPGTCEPGGTWNSGTARCDCGDGFERSDDGRSCVCADDGAEQTGYRASVLFPNPQSLFDGLRVGFVNTSSGNLTFLRRDIVTRAQGPAVFARVYDSRIVADDDFGPGWRLSLAEELLVDGDTATYVDESGARHAFAWTGTAWTASPPTPRHAATTLQFADAGGIRTAVLADGDAVRTFEQADAAGTRYVVRLVRTPARELVFDYDGGRLAAVSHDGATLFEVERDRDGRIAAVRDDHGRSVRYAYDSAGRLDTVRDIAGSDWRYLYRDDGLLGGAVDPEGRTYLAAAYDAAGRVARAFADGRLHDYAYAPGGTTVAEAAGEVHTLTRNAAGATTALSSTTGDSWSLTLDAANRVSTLTLPERTIGYAYGGHGKVATMTVADSVSGTTRMHSYDYDAQGRLVAVAGGGADATVVYAAGSVRIDDGREVLTYEVDERGRLASVRRGADPDIRVERDGAGDVVEISQGYRSVRFGRDALGRIVDATFADGSSARYFYDELGSSILAEQGDGSSVAYDYDASGGTTGIEKTHRDGTVRQWTAIAGAEPIGLVDDDGSAAHGAEHGAVAETVGFEVAHGETVTVRYGQRGAMASVAGVSRREEWTSDAAPPLRPASTAMISQRETHIQPEYGVMAFERNLDVRGRDPLEAGIAHLGDARALLESAAPLVGRQADGGYVEVAIPARQPPEYAVAASATFEATDGRENCPMDPPGDADDIPDLDIDDVPVVKTGTATPDPDGNVIFGVAVLTANETVECEAQGSHYKLVGQATIGGMEITAARFRQLGGCRTSGRGDDVDITIKHEKVHAQKILDVINTRNDDPVLGDVFDTKGLCDAARRTWEGEYERALNREKRRQFHHCDHVGEFKQELTCTFQPGFTGERTSRTESFPDPGSAICNPTP